MTSAEYAKIMHDTGVQDGMQHARFKYADVPEYAIGYAEGGAK